MYKIGMESLDLLPENRREELGRERLRLTQRLTRNAQVAEVQNNNGTDYSIAFNQAWTNFAQDCGLGLLAPQWPAA